MKKSKPVNMAIRFKLPKGQKISKASLHPNGDVEILDEVGNPVVPVSMERVASYDRPKGPKVQSKTSRNNGYVSIGGVKELTRYQSVFVIDTNTRIVNGVRISAACFIDCRFVEKNDQIQIECDGKIHVYEFHNVPEGENPEMLAILKVASDISRPRIYRHPVNITFITDSELGNLDRINNRDMPIFRGQLLPAGFSLQYASSETGKEAINHLIRDCDKHAGMYLGYLEEGSVKQTPLSSLAGMPPIKYRYMSRSDLTIVNPVVSGPSLRPGSVVRLYGLKESGPNAN